MNDLDKWMARAEQAWVTGCHSNDAAVVAAPLMAIAHALVELVERQPKPVTVDLSKVNVDPWGPEDGAA